jgi:glycosyltransferase involved in cell wall biosynthesis
MVVDLSIVTVAKNNLLGLKKTINSLRLLHNLNYEHIVIDGESTDGTIPFLASLKTNIKFFSEKDLGPYDAMNKGVEKCTGNWVLFLNAGDTLISTEALKNLWETACKIGCDVAYGDHFYKGKLIKADCIHNLHAKLLTGDVTGWLRRQPCHQSIIARKTVLINRPFNLKYQIAADREWLEICRQEKRGIHYIPGAIANYEAGGLSAKKFTRCVAEWHKVCILALGKKHMPYRKIFLDMIRRHLKKTKSPLRRLLRWLS